jgi:flagellar protein FlgJ
MTNAPTSLLNNTIGDVSMGQGGRMGDPGWGRPDIRTDNAGPAQLRQVSEEFEAIFLNNFLQQARQSQLSEGLFSSTAGDTFRGMLEQEYSRAATGSLSLGIADALYAQFSRHLNKADE